MTYHVHGAENSSTKRPPPPPQLSTTHLFQFIDSSLFILLTLLGSTLHLLGSYFEIDEFFL